jgi:2-oxoglutarate dehydrogenase E1 component
MSDTASKMSNIDYLNTSFLDGANAAYIEQLYAKYKTNPHLVDETMRHFFETMADEDQSVKKNAEGASWRRFDWPHIKQDEMISVFDSNWGTFIEKSEKKAANKPINSTEDIRKAVINSIRAIALIRSYRMRGHLVANLDPLGIVEKLPHPELDPSTYGFSEKDYNTPIFIDGHLGLEEATLTQMLEILKRTYCGTFTIEYMHISEPEERRWLQKRIEKPDYEEIFSERGRKAILNKIIEAEGFEKFLHTKYMGTKRFGLDGAEALVPALEQIIKRGGQMGMKEIVLGMPHRGRLNVLSNVMGKPYRAILNEFMGGSANLDDFGGSGDVKYHLGVSSDREFDGNRVHLSLVANPSHLEAVNPVVIGKVRAKQEKYNQDRSAVVPLLLHGDAAFSGQGIVAECFALSGLAGYKTGGTIHFIVNNQIGFTTSPQYSRSSPYPSDMGHMVQAPVLHVNGDDPEAVVLAARIAIEYRQMFAKDVVIDMFCYRRFGHNEGDEPSFTQPLMYKKIRNHKSTLQLHAERLIENKLVTKEEIDNSIQEFQQQLQSAFEAATSYKPNKADWLDGKWAAMDKAEDLANDRRGTTGVDINILKEVGFKLCEVPEGFTLHKTVERNLQAKKAMITENKNIDWATAEALAFGTLLIEGTRVRLSGQDSARGTFSQRHSSLVDQNNENKFEPLNYIRPSNQGKYEVIDSLLSEYAVLGFEYGYSWEDPSNLVLWEAQFGDFANGAQVMVDQFICSAETKWLRMSGLVMLLPHGYEGQGPEHSSARLERYLQLCAEDNIQVANCTTPANYFHILRRQIHRSFRKPLIMMTPKSLLRHKNCLSTLDDMANGTSFHRILLDDADSKNSPYKLAADKDIKRVVLCSGKVYYDLLETREEMKINNIYLLRLEQLYPVPLKTMVHELKRFENAEIVWCQEEPRNMGAWSFIEPNIEWALEKAGCKTKRPRYVGRNPSASTATGLASKHKVEQEKLIYDALTL